MSTLRVHKNRQKKNTETKNNINNLNVLKNNRKTLMQSLVRRVGIKAGGRNPAFINL
jgi:hypothetical protein